MGEKSSSLHGRRTTYRRIYPQLRSGESRTEPTCWCRLTCDPRPRIIERWARRAPSRGSLTASVDENRVRPVAGQELLIYYDCVRVARARDDMLVDRESWRGYLVSRCPELLGPRQCGVKGSPGERSSASTTIAPPGGSPPPTCTINEPASAPSNQYRPAGSSTSGRHRMRQLSIPANAALTDTSTASARANVPVSRSIPMTPPRPGDNRKSAAPEMSSDVIPPPAPRSLKKNVPPNKPLAPWISLATLRKSSTL